MKLSKVLLGSAVLAALMATAVFTSCKTDEDELGIIDKVEEDGFTNDTDTYYGRGYVSTKTKHLAADCQIDIDTSTSSGTYTMGYIFNQIGKGTEANPYSFVCVGIKYGTTSSNSKIRPLYFVSYYTGVLSSDFTSNAGDFDVSETEAKSWSDTTGTTVVANSAKEYDVSGGWIDIPTSSYTLAENKLTVYIDLSVLSGSTEITKDNYSNYKETVTDDDGDKVTKIKDGSYTVTLKKSAAATSGTDVTVSATTTKESNFVVQEAKLGRYAMVTKGSTLKGTWTFPSDSYIKAAVPTDGNTIIWNEEIDNIN